MPNHPPAESTYLLAADLVEKHYLRGLRSLLRIMLAGLPVVLVLTIVQDHGALQTGIVAGALATVALAYWLLQRGFVTAVSHLIVFSLIGFSAAGMFIYGSVRTAVMLGYAAAIVTAGMTLGRKGLTLAMLLSAAALGALTWAEASGFFVTPDFKVDMRFWLFLMMLLLGIAISVYTNRQLMLQALREQHAELIRREQAESELRLSEDRFTRIFRSSPAAIIVQSLADMAVLDVNPAFEKLYGYTRDEFVGGTDAPLWNDPAARRLFQQKVGATGRVINMPLDARTKTGELIHILLSCKVEGSGTARIVVSTVTDATAETRARQAALQSEELFSKAFDFSPINMNITRAADGVFLAVNAAADTIQGYTTEELVGRKSVDMGTWPSKEDRERFVSRLRRDQRVHNYETQMRHKDGHLVDCRMWAVVVNIAGEECFLSAIINITEQKRREALVLDLARGLSGETGELFFHSVVQNLGKAIAADLVMIGETTDGKSVTSLSMVMDGALQQNISYALAGTPCDFAVARQDICVYGHDLQQLFPQDTFLVEGGYQAYIGVALRDADGTPIGIVNAFWRKPQAPSPDRDALVQIFANRITAELARLRRDREIQRLNETLEQRVNERTEQLKATNAELESFGYSVSHDLQSPLRSIEGFSVLLARRLKGRLSEEEERLFDRVRGNVVRMHELINDLLALARVSKGKLSLQEVDLSAMAQQVAAQEKQRDPGRQVQVTVQPGISEHCDSKLARIILENLIGNAWKYSRQRPEAKIEFGQLPTREGGRRMLFVRDNGAGFNMAYADSLFKPFHRLHHETEFEGSGIGLATVHRILERHGGVIRAESAEGAGACFYFSFDPAPALRPVESV
jgi:PAS domain S-box-containing protein